MQGNKYFNCNYWQLLIVTANKLRNGVLNVEEEG